MTYWIYCECRLPADSLDRRWPVADSDGPGPFGQSSLEMVSAQKTGNSLQKIPAVKEGWDGGWGGEQGISS